MEFGNIEDPTNLAERAAVASTCMADLDLPMPALIDELDDEIATTYGALPDRLYVIGKDGRVTYAGGQGPFLFDPGAFDRALARAVAANEKTASERTDR